MRKVHEAVALGPALVLAVAFWGGVVALVRWAL